MFTGLRLIFAALFAGILGASGVLAQSGPPTFPTYTSDAPQRIAIVSRLNPEQKAALVRSIDAADLYGFFPSDLQATGQQEYGILLYVLSAWSDVEEIPATVLPPAALPQLRAVNPEYFRYAIPMRNSDGRSFVLMFYIASNPDPTVLQCLAQDLVVVVKTGFGSGELAHCARG